MEKNDVSFNKIPQSPGVYIFRGKKILYVGRAAVLRDRVRSYFGGDLVASRGQRLVEAIRKAKKVETIPTDSVLDAFLLEALLIKKYQPAYNVRDKDNKSFYFVGITEEDYPRVLIERGRSIEQGTAPTFKYVYGPFPQAGVLKDAMKIVRRLFPYRDKCSVGGSKLCFNAQISLCPGVCASLMSKREYARRIREIRLLFEGKKDKVISLLESDMHKAASRGDFNSADLLQRRISALKHIRDVGLIKGEFAEGGREDFRIEAYDTSHIQGDRPIGVMAVVLGGESVTSEYRSFIIRKASGDIGSLEEILSRRLKHREWTFPSLVVVDGGKAHLSAALKLLSPFGIPAVSVVKNERHQPKGILGSKEYAHAYERDILLANSEAHRFSIGQYRRYLKRRIRS